MVLIAAGSVGLLLCTCVSLLVFNPRIPLGQTEHVMVGPEPVEIQTRVPLLGFIPSHGGWGGNKISVTIRGQSFDSALSCRPYCGYSSAANAILILEELEDNETNAVVIDLTTGRSMRFRLTKPMFFGPFESLIPGCDDGKNGRVFATSEAIELWRLGNGKWDGVLLNLKTGLLEEPRTSSPSN